EAAWPVRRCARAVDSSRTKEDAMPLDTFQLGEPVEHSGIVVTPLFPRRDPVTEYVTLDEALPRGFRVDEASDAGTVPELGVHNPTHAPVLLYDGEELVGAKQDRILNV